MINELEAQLARCESWLVEEPDDQEVREMAEGLRSKIESIKKASLLKKTDENKDTESKRREKSLKRKLRNLKKKLLTRPESVEVLEEIEKVEKEIEKLKGVK